MQVRRSIALMLAASSLTLMACGESRQDKMRKQIEFDSRAGSDEPNPADEVPKIPAHPTRDALAPVLEKLYSAEGLPDVAVEEISVEGQNYVVKNPGALAYIAIRPNLGMAEEIEAILRGAAAVDAYVVRPDAERYFPEQLGKIAQSISEQERDKVVEVFAELRLLDYLASEAAAGDIGKLEGEAQSAVKAMQTRMVEGQADSWAKWMDVKLRSREVVAYDEPFKPLLRSLRKRFGMKEPEPITWEAAHDAPFKSWASSIEKDDELFKMLTNLSELREQVEFRGDTHARWAIEGSSLIPADAGTIEIDEELGFGVHREDLGGGEQDMTFVFPKRSQGAALKQAYLRSLIYRQVFRDFATLSAAGGDFEGGTVPDERDPDYAYCASRMALDGMLLDYGDKPLLTGLSASAGSEDEALRLAVECILERIPEGINRGVEGDDARPPAPFTRQALFAMMARFTKVDVNLEGMKADIDKSQEVQDAEAFLKDYDKKRREGG